MYGSVRYAVGDFQSHLSQFAAGEDFEHSFLGGWSQDIMCRELLSLRIIRPPNALGGFREVVGRVPKLNVAVEQQPICAGLSERHAHAAGIHYPDISDQTVKLHVSMTADDQRHAEPLEDR